MQSSIPPVTGPQSPRTPSEAGLSDELAAAVSGARRRALRDGDRHIDTAHLLHSLLEADPYARSFVDPAHLARLLGLLVQRSIGYGLRWQGTVEDSGSVPVVQEAGWSPAATLAMDRARERAGARCGAGVPSGADLIAALAGDPQCRAAEILGRAGVDLDALSRVLDVEAGGRDGAEGHELDGRVASTGQGAPDGFHVPAPRPHPDGATSAGGGHDFARGIDVSELRQGHRE